MALEVVWPRHKWDYLTVPDPDMPVDPPLLASTWMEQGRHGSMSDRVASAPFEISESNEEFAARQVMSPSRTVPEHRRTRIVRDGAQERSTPSLDATERQSRALAVHAFLQGAQCRERRVSALLDVSARTVGRDRARPPVKAPPIREHAQTLIAASADRGSTPEERAAAGAWLTAGATPATIDVTDSNPAGETAEPGGSSPPMEVSMSPERQAAPTHASLTRDQMDACGRLHRRIRIRTDVIRRLLEPEIARDDLTEVVLELLVEIRSATEALETLLRPPAK